MLNASARLSCAAAVGFTGNTLVGLLGVGGTVLAFVLPRLVRALPDGRLSYLARLRWLDSRAGVPVHADRRPLA